MTVTVTVPSNTNTNTNTKTNKNLSVLCVIRPVLCSLRSTLRTQRMYAKDGFKGYAQVTVGLLALHNLPTQRGLYYRCQATLFFAWHAIGRVVLQASKGTTFLLSAQPSKCCFATLGRKGSCVASVPRCYGSQVQSKDATVLFIAFALL